MRLRENHAFAVGITERLAFLEGILADSPACGMGILDPAGRIGDAAAVLADVGIATTGHAALQGRAVVEFLAVADVGILGDAAREADVRGWATRTLRLRDGQLAELHLVEISDVERTTVVVIVPGAGATIAGTPPPTAIRAGPRVGLVRCDAFGTVLSASEGTLALLGRPNSPIDGIAILDLIHPDDQEMAVVNWLAAKEQPREALRWRCRLVRADGSALWIEATITNEICSDGTGEVHFDLHDISREVAATEALVAERELIALLTETLPVGVAKFDAAGHVEHANRRLTDLLAPLDPQLLLEQAVCGELDDLDLAAAFAALIDDGVGSRLVVDHVGEDGVLRHLEWTIRAALAADGAVTGGVVCIADVTEAARLRASLEARACTDALTGCLNRAGTISAIERALASVGWSEGIGLLFIDLDGFKGINDSRGHAVGDSVLEVVASRLRAALRPGDQVGRLGGDEFVVISPGLHSASAALVFAGRISRQFQEPIVLADTSVSVAASIGVAWASKSTASELLGAADAAMYVAKQTHSPVPILAAQHA